MILTFIVAAVFGLLIGSFTNVLIARVPEGRSWARGTSQCPHCKEAIAWYDNIPLLSYIALRGRCRRCQASISVQYPAVELGVAVSFVAIVWAFGVTWTAGLLAYTAMISVALAVIDARHHRLPHRLVLPSIGVVSVGALVGDMAFDEGSALRALIGAALVAGVYGLLWFVYPQGMGFGDVTTAAMLGIVMGYLSWSTLAAGSIAGPILAGAVVLIGMMAGRVQRRSRIPYGPFLIAGAWVGILAGEWVADAYLGFMGVTTAG